MFASLANMPKAQTYADKLATAHGDAYAIAIATAAVHQISTPSLPEDAGFSGRYKAQVQELHDAIVRAEGMKAVAVAIALHAGQLRYTAEREFDQHVTAVAQAIYTDRLNNLSNANGKQST